MKYTDVKAINLTNHVIRFVDGTELKPSGIVCRCDYTEKEVGNFHGTAIIKFEYNGVYGLPPKQEGIIYIVSSVVLNAIRELMPERDDCVAVGKLIKDRTGKVIAAQVLRLNG